MNIKNLLTIKDTQAGIFTTESGNTLLVWIESDEMGEIVNLYDNKGEPLSSHFIDSHGRESDTYL